MAKFEVAILNDKLVRRTTRDLMWTPLKPSDGSTDTYGLGWTWGDENDHDVASVGHNGGQQGTSTTFAIVPERRVGVVVLTNMEGQPASDLAREILKILVAAPENKP
jgi:CubicO group peptidase (beta-lactamase class C family)